MNIKKYLLLSFLMLGLTLFSACGDDFSCTDGKQNQGERGIDCGDEAGKCPPCDFLEIPVNNPIDTTDMPIDTMDMPIDTMMQDSIGNNIGLDCGGTGSQFCAVVGDSTWVGLVSDLATPPLTLENNNLEGSIFSSEETSTFTFGVNETLALGTYDMNNDSFISIQEDGFTYRVRINKGTGTMTIQKFDPTEKIISGTFEFIGFNAAETDSIVVTNGVFIDVPYK